MKKINQKREAKRLAREADKKWADDVKIRDGYACVICGSKIALNSHHIIVREHKPTKHDINNGITLCILHHMFGRVISAHNNPLAFFVWMEKHRPDQLRYLKEIMAKEIEKSTMNIDDFLQS